MLREFWVDHYEKAWALYPEGTKARPSRYEASFVKVGDKWIKDANTVLDTPVNCDEVLLPEDYQTRLIELKSPDKSFRIDRTKWNKKERAFAENWIDENIQRGWLNHGYGILQGLFIEGGERPLEFPRLITRITKRDRMIVATIVQWLGTNCGWCFLEECLHKCGYKIVKKGD